MHSIQNIEQSRTKPLIFVVDDNGKRAGLACSTLEQAGYTVSSFETAEVIEVAERQLPDLLLIAVNLCKGGGLDLCRRTQECQTLSRTRIVLVVDTVEEGQAAVAEAGADDFISSPFSPGELITCVQAVLHLLASRPVSLSSPGEAEIVIDSLAMRLKVRGSEVQTTTLEFRLIDYMARHHGKVFTRDALLDAVWGDLRFVTPRSVDACVGRIRRKIEPNRTAPSCLKTIRGIGYKLDATTAWEATPGEICHCLGCSLARARTKTASRVPTTRTGT